MKLLSSQREINDFFGIEPLLSLSIRTTGKCNLHCKNCYASSGTPLKNELAKEEIVDLLFQAKDLGAIRVFFTGGEPFIREDILEILRVAAELKYAVYLSSNGTLISEEKASQLADLKLEVLQISLDGLVQTHDYLRGRKGAFGKAVKTIKLLRRQLRKTKLAVAFTLTKDNYRQTQEVFELAAGLGVDIFSLIPLFRCGRSSGENDVSPELKRQVFSEVSDLFLKKRNLPGWNTELSILASRGVVPEVLAKTEYGKGFVCTFPNIFGIDANGDVFPCDGLIGREELYLGNLREYSLAEMWNHKAMLKLRKINTPDLKGACSVCRFLEECAGGCRASSYLDKKSFYESDSLCQSFFDKKLI